MSQGPFESMKLNPRVVKVNLKGERSLRRRSLQRGFTLLEVMIAVAVTLLMMLGLAQMFKVLGDSMNKGRAGLELNNKLRSVMHRVRTDLDNVTAPARPPLPVGAGQGYLKYYEGPASDYTFANNPLLNRFGDVDDIFMATVKAKDTWFTGKVPQFIVEGRSPENLGEFNNLVTIASQFAEVVIFAQPEYDTNNTLRGFRLHYRTLLIRPDLNLVSTGNLPANSDQNLMVVGSSPTAMANWYQSCDLSMRRAVHPHLTSSPRVELRANTLEDLADPANRFAHSMLPVANNIWSMPFITLGPEVVLGGEPPLLFPATTSFLDPAFVLRDDRRGEDVLATGLLAFDIRGYDPTAPILQYDLNPNLQPSDPGKYVTLRPGEPGYLPVGLQSTITGLSTVAAYGEFVDLNWAGKFFDGREQQYIIDPLLSNNSFNRNLIQSELSGRLLNGSIADSLFRSGAVKLPSQFSPATFQAAYDTFSNLYESDGVLQAELANRGLVNFSSTPNVNQLREVERWRANQIDAGTDGIDNNPTIAPGIDDSSELETSPPFPVHLRGLQISIRLEDGSKKQFKQMSTVKEFVTN